MELKTAVALSVWVHRVLMRSRDGGGLRQVGAEYDERWQYAGNIRNRVGIRGREGSMSP